MVVEGEVHRHDAGVGAADDIVFDVVHRRRTVIESVGDGGDGRVADGGVLFGQRAALADADGVDAFALVLEGAGAVFCFIECIKAG